MWFKVLYLIYLTLAFVYPGSFGIGPLSARILVMLALLVICRINGLKWDMFMSLYTIFLACFGLSSLLTGFFELFIEKLFGTYLQVYVFYFATNLLINKYKGEKWVYYFFLLFGLLDAFVTIGQFYNNGIVNSIVEILGINYDEEFVSKLDRFDTLEGFSLPGLVGNVRNGYFLSATAIFSLYNYKGKVSSFNIALWFVIMVASLLSQERMGFFVALLFSIFIIVFSFSAKYKKYSFFIIILFFFIGIILLPKGIDMLLSSDLRFSKGVNLNDERSGLARIGWQYFLNNPLGGFYKFDALGYPYPHNVFVNMFLVGGIFGGLAILIMFFGQILTIVKCVLDSVKINYFSLTTFFGMAFLAYSANSLTHNASLVYGTFEFFIFWSAFEALTAKESFHL